MPSLKKCNFPKVNSFFFREFRSLVDLRVALKAQSRHCPVMSFDRPTFSESELIRMSGDHGPIFCTTKSTRQLSNRLKKPMVSVIAHADDTLQKS